MITILKNSTGYKRLDVYVLMNIIQLETLKFCRNYLDWKNDDPCGRQFDQMTQAARSGVKNLTEGSERGATSAQTLLKLLDVARASLCELRDDYMTWLLDRDLPPWRQHSPEADEVYKVLLERAEYGDDVNYDVAIHIIRSRAKFRKWFRPRPRSAALDCNRLQSTATGSNREPSTATDGIREPSTGVGSIREHSTATESTREQSGVVFVNAMLILIGRAIYMLSNLMARKGEEFRKEGGFSERMTSARAEARRNRSLPVDEDAPKCPNCGGEMRLRHGRNGDFWGCVAYPGCRGTLECAR